MFIEETAVDLISDQLVQLEKALMLQSTINGRLIETMNALLLRVAQLEIERNNDTNGSRIILPAVLDVN